MLVLGFLLSGCRFQWGFRQTILGFGAVGVSRADGSCGMEEEAHGKVIPIGKSDDVRKE